MNIGNMKHWGMFDEEHLKLLQKHKYHNEDLVEVYLWHWKDVEPEEGLIKQIAVSDTLPFEYIMPIIYRENSNLACEYLPDMENEVGYDSDGNPLFHYDDKIMGSIIDQYFENGEFYRRIRLNKEYSKKIKKSQSRPQQHS